MCILMPHRQSQIQSLTSPSSVNEQLLEQVHEQVLRGAIGAQLVSTLSFICTPDRWNEHCADSIIDLMHWSFITDHLLTCTGC